MKDELPDPKYNIDEYLKQKIDRYASGTQNSIIDHLMMQYQDKAFSWFKANSHLDKFAIDEIFEDLFAVLAMETFIPQEQSEGMFYLYERYGEPMLRYIRKHNIPPKNEPLRDNDDIVMLNEAFVVLKQKASNGVLKDDYFVSGKPCMAFIYGVLKNLVRKYWFEYHNDKGRNEIIVQGDATEITLPEDFFGSVEAGISFELLLVHLEKHKDFPAYCRPLLEAIYFYDQSMEEYAERANEQLQKAGEPPKAVNAYHQQKSRCQKKAWEILKSEFM